jgi:hypothetical protein
MSLKNADNDFNSSINRDISNLSKINLNTSQDTETNLYLNDSLNFNGDLSSSNQVDLDNLAKSFEKFFILIPQTFAVKSRTRVRTLGTRIEMKFVFSD